MCQTQYMTADNINIGIGAILETFEMAYVSRVAAHCLKLNASIS